MCSEAEARQIIGADGASVLVDIIEGAWQAYLDGGPFHHRRTRASVVWDYMVTSAHAQLARMDGVRVAEVKGQTPVFVLRERIAVRFKLHDRDMLTKNLRTRTQARLSRTGSFDEMPSLATVSCGYVLDNAEAAVQHVVAVRAVEDEVAWCIDLRELAGGVLAPESPILSPLDVGGPLPPLPSIRRPSEESEGSPE